MEAGAHCEAHAPARAAQGWPAGPPKARTSEWQFADVTPQQPKGHPPQSLASGVGCVKWRVRPLPVGAGPCSGAPRSQHSRRSGPCVRPGVASVETPSEEGARNAPEAPGGT